MGYTHYWFTDKISQEDYNQALKAIKTYIGKVSGIQIALSPLSKGIIKFNDANEPYEDFVLQFGKGFEFCKTEHKPYDKHVVAVLCILNHYCPGADIKSDGDPHEWLEGLILVRKALKDKTIKIPPNVYLLKGFNEWYKTRYIANNTFETSCKNLSLVY